MPKVIAWVIAAVYPLLVFCFLVVLKIPLRYFSIFVVFAAFAVFIGAGSKKKNAPRVAGAALLGGLGLACLLSNQAVFLKLYPVLMNAVMLGAFGFTLFSPPPMIFRFALLADKTIRGSLAEKRIERYCRRVTVVWCGFFVLNGGAAVWTVFAGSDLAWSVYNGGLSYILIGLLFAGEFGIRKAVDKKMPKAIPLSQFKASSRPPGHVMCYDRAWADGAYKTWRDFLEDTARLRQAVVLDGAEKWILHAEDCWYFLCAFTALLQCRREIRLTANISPAYIAEIRAETGLAFITDRRLSEEDAGGAALFIPDLLAGEQTGGVAGVSPAEGGGGRPPQAGWSQGGDLPPHLRACLKSRILALQTPKFYLAGSKRARKSGFLRSIGRKNLQSKQALTPPPINPDETAIVMYTSGTTGRPKLVRQRLTEFENDNRFIISKWGDAWLSRKVCATVSQHHIYGLLFGILLPFTAGVPFRRRRVEAPEEFAMLRDQPLMIVTVPAFLKRAVELSPEGFGLRDAWLYSSGGVLERETAAKTAKVFGFWPVEVYGSTETSGIAWRQSKDGPEWTPFDNAEVRLDDEGRLVIRSPYIKDTAGFTTGDLAELLAGGRFLLKGRADSIVKIEEKRVSLPEVEARLLQSGLVEGAAVIALGGRRQQLGAAIALNGRGAEQLRGMEKLAMNRWFRDYLARFFEPAALPKKWRYVQSIPLDAQGKRKRAEIEALFAPALSERRGLAGETILEQSAVKAALEFSVLPESDYFNEHFPAMKILPAVAQFELAVRFASRLLGTPPQARRAKRLKFSALVRPNTPLRLELSKSGEPPQVSFSFTSPDGGTVYSSGAFEIWGGGGG